MSNFLKRWFPRPRKISIEIGPSVVLVSSDLDPADRDILEVAIARALLFKVSPDPVPECSAPPVLSADEIVRMIKGQISQDFDSYRMARFWERLLSGPTPPKDVALALCLALSGGRYVERQK